MDTPMLSRRLLSVAKFVRDGAFIADVGTDHAYLPIFLAQSRKISGAVASDINKGPYLIAKKNIEDSGLSHIITIICTDGLSGIEKFSPTDILICGMGGELIANILSRAPWIKNEKTRLVLQPMTHAEILRKFLLDNGFSIIGEKLVKEEKIYQVICAEYTASKESYSAAELLLGKLNIEKRTEEFYELLCHQINTLEKIRLSKLSGGARESETPLIKLLEEIKNDCK